VLGSDEAVVQESRFLLGKDQHPTSLGREALEHDAMVRTGPAGVIAGPCSCTAAPQVSNALHLVRM
jgi:hypothetical protein